MVTVIALLVVLILLCLFMAWALVYVHWESLRRMDFFDTARRLGPVSTYLALALACLLLFLRVGPEWRLPPMVLALLMTAVGISRDVKREWLKRKGRS
jgi:hypothetical protein